MHWYRTSLKHLWKLSALLAIFIGAHGILGSIAFAAPSDALKILGNAGQSGLAQDVGLDQAKKDIANGIAKDAAAKTGSKVYFVMLKRDDNPSEYTDLYTQLGMQGKDLLVASNGTRWEVKCAALSHDAKQAVMDRALKVPGLDPLGRLRELSGQLTTAINEQAVTTQLTWNQFEAANAGRGWTSSRMSAEWARYKQTGGMPAGTTTALVSPSSTPVATNSGTGVGTWVFLGVFVAAIVAFVLYRRRKRDAGLTEELKKALAAPEGVLTDIYMNMEGLESHPRFGQMLEAATACQAKLDALKSGTPTREAIAKVRSLNDEANRVRRQFDDARMTR